VLTAVAKQLTLDRIIHRLICIMFTYVMCTLQASKYLKTLLIFRIARLRDFYILRIKIWVAIVSQVIHARVHVRINKHYIGIRMYYVCFERSIRVESRVLGTNHR
jgi:hypothetical protein